MCLKLGHWGCSLHAFDKEMNALVSRNGPTEKLLCKGDFFREMVVIIQEVTKVT